MKNKRGFTLIELIIGFAIMSIISAIAIPKFSNIIDSQKAKACNSIRQNIMEHYKFQKSINEDMTLEKLLDTSNEYFNEDICCPSGGDYIITNGAIICTIHNNLPIDSVEDEDDEDDDENNKYPEWDPDGEYWRWDIVSYNEKYFYAIWHIKWWNPSPENTVTPWHEIPKWDNTIRYRRKDIVEYNGLIYRYIYRHNENDYNNPENSEKWVEL